VQEMLELTLRPQPISFKDTKRATIDISPSHFKRYTSTNFGQIIIGGHWDSEKSNVDREVARACANSLRSLMIYK